jgi:hypothetical protein
MPITVSEFRLSMVWNKVFAKDTNLPSLADPAVYRTAFGDAAAGGPNAAWLMPWIAGHPQHFWQYYLSPVTDTSFQLIKAADARSYFVPLRVAPFAHAKSRDGVEATLEGFCYPHSTAVVATVRLRPESPMTMPETVNAAVTARNADYNLSWADPKRTATHGALQSLADKAVGYLHELVRIDATALGVPLPPPITIATVIDAKGEDDDGVLEQSLLALCPLRPGWQKAKLEFESEGPPQSNGDRLGAIGKGRSIWLPNQFSDVLTKGRKTALGCYHRNVTLASMQTAALVSLVGRADEVLLDPNGRLISISPGEVEQAIRIVELLKSGDDTTYRCWSMLHQTSYYAPNIARVSAKLGVLAAAVQPGGAAPAAGNPAAAAPGVKPPVNGGPAT